MRRFALQTSTAALIALTSINAFPAHAFTADPLVSAWIPAWAGDEAITSFTSNLQVFDEINLFWYALADDGSLTVDKNAEDRNLIRTAQSRGIRVYMTVRNGFIGQRFHDMVSDPAKRAQHIADLLAKVDAFGYDGIDIDYEGLRLEDRDAFTQFLRDLASPLHERNKFLAVAIQAKTSNPGEWDSLKAQDWPAIGQIVDRFRIMTYDKHYSGSGPGAVSPLPWVQQVARFAATQLPPEKIQLGIAFYGYSWQRGGRGASITWTRAQELLEQYDVPPGYNETEKAPYFAYEKDMGDGTKLWYDAWFENARSVQDKINAYHDLNVGGVAVWRLGDEDPGNFAALGSVHNRPVATRFDDVPDDSLAAAAIHDLRARGVVQGEGGRFSPQRSVTRAEAVKIALGHLRFPAIATDPGASDVPLSEWSAPFIATAKARKIVGGYEDGTFRPWAPITRAEALKLILRARSIPAGGSSALPPDVPNDAWYAELLRSALDRGIVRGDSDGRFRPDDPVTRAEFVALLTRA